MADEAAGPDGTTTQEAAKRTRKLAFPSAVTTLANVRTMLRRVLEVGVITELAARELSAGEREAIATALDECLDADVDSFRRHDSRLHLLFAELTGSPGLVQLSADLRTRLNLALDSMPMMPPNLSHSNEQHAQIVGAVLSGRPEVAAKVMLEHLAGTEALLRGFVEK